MERNVPGLDLIGGKVGVTVLPTCGRNAGAPSSSVPAMGRLGPAKCIWDQSQLSRRHIVEVHRNNIESHVLGLLAQTTHIQASHAPDHAPLIGVHGRFRRRNIEPATRLDLDETQGIALPADQVQIAWLA
jgi:hypothetical protein